jgi:hypothetical protein
LLDPEHQLEIADISLEGDPVQSMNFDLPSATWPTSDLPNLGLTARMKTQMGGYFTEQAPDVQLTLNNAYDAAMDLIQGEVIFQDSDEVDGAYGAAMGMILTETTPGAGATRTVEFELGFVDGTAAGVALQPLPDPAVDSERRWRQNLPLDFIGPTGALSSSGQMELRMKVPDNQPWMIAGIDVSPQPTEARWVATVVLQAMGAKTPLPDAALLEVTVTGDMTRVDGTDTPFQRPTGELRMWASPSVMDASTTFRFSRALPTPKKLQVYDVRGRLVRRLMMKAESVALPWDGRDDDGANLASGVYFAVIVDEVDRPSVKIVKMK